MTRQQSLLPSLPSQWLRGRCPLSFAEASVSMAAPFPLPFHPRPIRKRPTTHVSINILASQMGDVRDHLEMFSKRMSATGKISQQDLDNLMKEEKIRIAMEKLASAQMQKVNSF